MIELPPAVIRHIDDVDAVLDGEVGVLGSLNPFQHQRQLHRTLQFLYERPFPAAAMRLAAAQRAERPPGHRVPPMDVALAAAERRHVDGQAQRFRSGLSGALPSRAVSSSAAVPDVSSSAPGPAATESKWLLTT